MIIRSYRKYISKLASFFVGAAVIGAIGYMTWHTLYRGNTQSKKNTVSNSSNKYLDLSDWGIKFKVPQNLDGIKTYKLAASPNKQAISDYYEFTTQRVEALGEQCSGSTLSGGVIRLALIDRTHTKVTVNMTGTPVNNNQPVAGYYYYVSVGHSLCSDKGSNLQYKDQNALYTMLLHPIAI